VSQAKRSLGQDQRPKYLQVRERLADMAGELSPGTALPTEHELCELFGVSLSTLRRARKPLEAAQPMSARPQFGGKDRSVPQLRLRAGKPDDAVLLAGVFVAAWRSAYPGIVSHESLRRLDEVEIARWLRTLVGSRESTTVVAEADEGGRVVGFCRFGRDPEVPMLGHVFSLYVSPDASRRGFGRRLLAHALSELARRHLEPVTLWVFEENAAARRFYSAFGFLPDGARLTEPEYGAEEIRLRRASGATL